jgi:multidrug efflux pump subunit AcrB
LAANVAKAFAKTPGIVGVDTSLKADGPRQWLQVRTQRAETLGIPVSAIARTVQGSLQGVDATYMRNDSSKLPVPVRLQLPLQSQVGLKDVLAMPMRAANGQLVPLSELVEIKTEVIQKPLFTKDLLPVSYVMGDMAGSQDSPL